MIALALLLTAAPLADVKIGIVRPKHERPPLAQEIETELTRLGAKVVVEQKDADVLVAVSAPDAHYDVDVIERGTALELLKIDGDQAEGAPSVAARISDAIVAHQKRQATDGRRIDVRLEGIAEFSEVETLAAALAKLKGVKAAEAAGALEGHAQVFLVQFLGEADALSELLAKGIGGRKVKMKSLTKDHIAAVLSR